MRKILWLAAIFSLVFLNPLASLSVANATEDSTDKVDTMSKLYGTYQLQEEDSLIGYIVISEDTFSLILNDEIAPADYHATNHVQKFLDLSNLDQNHSSLGIGFEEDYHEDIQPKYIDINFARDGSYSFRIDVINPEYGTNSQYLYVRHFGIEIWAFNIEEPGTLVDYEGFVFTLETPEDTE